MKTVHDALMIAKNALDHIKFDAFKRCDKLYVKFESNDGKIILNTKQLKTFVDSTIKHLNNMHIQDIYKDIVIFSRLLVDYIQIIDNLCDNPNALDNELEALSNSSRHAQILVSPTWTIEIIFSFIPSLFLYAKEDMYKNFIKQLPNDTYRRNLQIIRNSLSHTSFSFITNSVGIVQGIEFVYNSNTLKITTDEFDVIYRNYFKQFSSYLDDELNKIKKYECLTNTHN